MNTLGFTPFIKKVFRNNPINFFFQSFMQSYEFEGIGTLISSLFVPMMRIVLIYRSPTSWEPQEEGMMSTAAVFPQ
jgi:hypothetical protein